MEPQIILIDQILEVVYQNHGIVDVKYPELKPHEKWLIESFIHAFPSKEEQDKQEDILKILTSKIDRDHSIPNDLLSKLSLYTRYNLDKYNVGKNVFSVDEWKSVEIIANSRDAWHDIKSFEPLSMLDRNLDSLSQLHFPSYEDLVNFIEDLDKKWPNTISEDDKHDFLQKFNYGRNQTNYLILEKSPEEAAKFYLSLPTSEKLNIRNLFCKSYNRMGSIKEMLLYRNIDLVIDRFVDDSRSEIWDIPKSDPLYPIVNIFACWVTCRRGRVLNYIKSKLGKYEAMVKMLNYDFSKVKKMLASEYKDLFDNIKWEQEINGI